MNRIYLDYNATTPLHPDVHEGMEPYFRDVFGNPSSIHWFGQGAHRAIENARRQVANLIGAEPNEIVFTSGGTESNNHAIRGVAGLKKGCSHHIITSQIEHRAVLNTCGYLEKKGFQITYLPVDEYGFVDPRSVSTALDDNTILITIMLANNDVGSIQNLKEIAETVQGRGIVVHTDAAQAAGKILVDVKQLGVDMLSMSGHKLYGPKGIGALYIKRGIKVNSLIFGGNHEKNRRAGTENVPGIVGLGKACEIASNELIQNAARITLLRDKLEKGILSQVPHVRLNGHPERRLPNTSNLSFSFIEGESLLMNLDLAGIAVSAGSACTSGSTEPSHVLTAMGVIPEQGRGSIRFSLGRGTSESEIAQTIKAVVEIVGRLREESPLYADSGSIS